MFLSIQPTASANWLSEGLGKVVQIGLAGEVVIVHLGDVSTGLGEKDH
jgi:hypothetical protein